jgi:AcrR family transcriptional regulator
MVNSGEDAMIGRMRSVSRTRLGTDERKERLLDLGRELFNAHTYDEISIDDIAAAAGVSKGLLYHYFPSKRHFYVEAVRAAAKQMQVLTQPDEALPPIERLQVGVEAYLDYVETNAGAYANLMRSGVGADREVADIVEETRRAIVRRILRGLGVPRPKGILRVAVRGWVGFVEATSLDWIEHRDLSRDALRAMMILALESALAAAGTIDPRAALRPAPPLLPLPRASGRK